MRAPLSADSSRLWPGLSLVWLLVCMPAFALLAGHTALGFWGMVLWLLSVPFVWIAVCVGCWRSLRRRGNGPTTSWKVWLVAAILWTLTAAACAAMVLNGVLGGRTWQP